MDNSEAKAEHGRDVMSDLFLGILDSSNRWLRLEDHYPWNSNLSQSLTFPWLQPHLPSRCFPIKSSHMLFWHLLLGRSDNVMDFPCVLVQKDPGVESEIRMPRASLGNSSQLVLDQTLGEDSVPERGEL